MESREWDGRPSRALLAPNEEDRFTEYLSQLLRSNQVRSSFLIDLLNEDLTRQEVSALSVETQVPVPAGRADLVLDSDHDLFLFEAKVSSWLHEGQIPTYATYVLDKKNENNLEHVGLYILAPASQLIGLVNESQEGVNEFEIKGISWEKIGEHFAKLAEDTTLSRLRTYLLDFSDLVAYRLGDLARPFTHEETLILSDRLVASALDRADSLLKPAAHELDAILGKELEIRKNTGAFWSGFRFIYKEKEYWFGIWVYTWAKIGVSPIAIQIYDELPLGVEWPNELPSPQVGDWKGSMVPIPIHSQMEPQIQARAIAENLASIMKTITP